jgi:hypothetical protein
MRRCKALKGRLWEGEVGKECTIELHWDCTVKAWSIIEILQMSFFVTLTLSTLL